MRAAALRRLLEDVPDLADVTVRIEVGGDLVTDDVDVELTVTGDRAGTRVVLIPVHGYEITGLIDDGLAAREFAARMTEGPPG